MWLKKNLQKLQLKTMFGLLRRSSDESVLPQHNTPLVQCNMEDHLREMLCLFFSDSSVKCCCSLSEMSSSNWKKYWTGLGWQSVLKCSADDWEVPVTRTNLQLLFFFPTVGLAPSVPNVAGRCTPATGCEGLGAACTTWPVSLVSPVRGSCPLGKSSAWWRAGCSAAATMTSCWTTSAGLQKMVTAMYLW